jgi:thiamine kinase-like enzyme
LDTIEKGGDGYCLHQTMLLRSDTVHLLRRIQAVARRGATGAVRSDDVMHFDLNPANILHLDGKLTAVVDWNVPFTGSSQGDRGFDLATLLFYSYDLSTTRELIWQRLIEVSGAGWASVYLAHLCLRQVEWSLRHRPGSAELTRFLQIAVGVMERFGPSLPL